MRWEGLTESFYVSPDGDDVAYQKHLETRGREGWALLACIRERPLDLDDNGTVYRLSFTRPVSENQN